MDGLRNHLKRYMDTFLTSVHSQLPVNEMWVSLKTEVIAAIERNDQDKIDSSIRRLIRKLDTLNTFVLASQAVLTLRTITNGS